MKLTPRATDIIHLLAQQPEGYPLTLAALSDQLQVSRRTLQRVLPEIRDWMDKGGYRFSAKAGAGLTLDEPDDTRRAILAQVGGSASPAGQGRNAVRNRLICLLLASEEPLKMAWLARQCDVSEGTLEKELDEAERWLGRYNVLLCRRAGVGIAAQRSEHAHRLAVEAAVTEFSDSAALLRLLQGRAPEVEDTAAQLPDFVIPADAARIRDILSGAEQRLDVHLTDSGFISLFVHLALAVQRVRAGKLVQMERERLQGLQLLPEYAVAEYVTDQLSESFHLKLPPDETGFVTVHLAGSHIWQRDTPDRTETAELDTLHLALAVTEVMERQLGEPFRGHERLIDGLCTHLHSVASRLRLGTPIGHPQMMEIQNGYPDLFAAAKTACQCLALELGIAAVPDDEAAYIAMHFGAVLEERYADRRQVTAVVVCPSGLGTSRLLAAELRRAFPQILICDVLSALRLDIDRLRREGIDLIVSTVELDVPYRAIRVDPVLTARDRTLLGAALDEISRQKPAEGRRALPLAPLLARQDVRFVSAFGAHMLALVDGVRCVRAPIVHTRAELIAQAALLFAADETAANDIELAFTRRDQLADTYIKPFYALLLHCCTPFTAHCRFGYVHLEPPFYENGRAQRGALVMLIPQQDETEACTALMSEVSALLLRQPALLMHMRALDTAALAAALEHELMEVYRTVVRKRLSSTPDAAF